MADPFELVVIAPPVRLVPTTPVDGAERLLCEGCGELVWVAPTSQPLLAKGALLLCEHCALADMEARQAQGEPVEFTQVDGQDAEIAATLRRIRLGHDVAERGN